jgi:hypothetical protein
MIAEERRPTMNMTPNGMGKFTWQSDPMRHLKAKAIGAMVVFLAAVAFGSGLKHDLQEAESRYQGDSQTNEPVARQLFIKELHRIRAKAKANHKTGIVLLVDSQIKELEERNTPVEEQPKEGLVQDLLYRFPPYAQPVPGKPGFVFSPFGNKKHYIDVRGYGPNQEVKDPYTGGAFLVPWGG